MSEKDNQSDKVEIQSIKRVCKYCGFDKYFSTQEIVLHENECSSYGKKSEDLKYFVVEGMQVTNHKNISPYWKNPYSGHIRIHYKLLVIYCETEEELQVIMKDAYFQYYRVIYSYKDILVYRKTINRSSDGKFISSSQGEKIYLKHPDILPSKGIDWNNYYHIHSSVNRNLEDKINDNYPGGSIGPDCHCISIDNFAVIYHGNDEENCLIDIQLNTIIENKDEEIDDLKYEIRYLGDSLNN